MKAPRRKQVCDVGDDISSNKPSESVKLCSEKIYYGNLHNPHFLHYFDSLLHVTSTPSVDSECEWLLYVIWLILAYATNCIECNARLNAMNYICLIGANSNVRNVDANKGEREIK